MRNILLVGLGGMGRVHLANYAYLGDMARVVAVVGKTDADRAFAATHGLDFHDDMEDAVRCHCGIDTIDITTPSWLHRENVLQALALDRDVICEKPLALSSRDAYDMYEEAHRRGRMLIPALVCRYTKEFALLKQAVEGGAYGRLKEVRFTRLSEKPAWSEGAWLLDRDRSGLVPFDLMIHDIDMMVALLGVSVELLWSACGGVRMAGCLYPVRGDMACGVRACRDRELPFRSRALSRRWCCKGPSCRIPCSRIDRHQRASHWMVLRGAEEHRRHARGQVRSCLVP